MANEWDDEFERAFMALVRRECGTVEDFDDDEEIASVERALTGLLDMVQDLERRVSQLENDLEVE